MAKGEKDPARAKGGASGSRSTTPKPGELLLAKTQKREAASLASARKSAEPPNRPLPSPIDAQAKTESKSGSQAKAESKSKKGSQQKFQTKSAPKRLTPAPAPIVDKPVVANPNVTKKSATLSTKATPSSLLAVAKARMSAAAIGAAPQAKAPEAKAPEAKTRRAETPVGKAPAAAPAPVVPPAPATPPAPAQVVAPPKLTLVPSAPVPPAPEPREKPAAGPAFTAFEAGPAADPDPFRIQALDVEKLSANAARAMEEAGKAVAAYLKPREAGEKGAEGSEAVADVVKTIGHVAEYWLKDPQKALEAQTTIVSRYMDLWGATLRTMAGETVAPVVKDDPKDARFKDPQWRANPFFDFLKQFYLTTASLAEKFVSEAELDEHLKHKASFYTKQIANALSPSNFVMTNPELLRETIASNGENLVRGLHMMAEDIARGGGDLKIRQSDETPFVFGKNIAVTPGKVVFENDLMQLIQYTPTTPTVGAVPLVIVPPWINKFYILDLNAEKSFVRWCVAQGLTVFIVSWVNPDARHAHKSFDDYMLEGPVKAFEVASAITGAPQVHSIGYCVGGTLLAVTLAWLAAKKRDVVRTATFFTTQVDFTYAGDLKVFVDEDQIAALERKMAAKGYLEGKSMANAFNMLRSNDLIWSYFINNYMKGKSPTPFDLLYWNADSPRMPAANHSFYLRHCYLNNDLSNARMKVGGETLDLKKVMTPIYNLATKEDHIAPARSVFVGSSAFGGPVSYVMAGSGHIAGVVNPPDKVKYQHWVGGPPTGRFEDWVAKAEEHPGSWWPHWREWVRGHDGDEVPARPLGSNAYPPIEDAPGRYVAVRD